MTTKAERKFVKNFPYTNYPMQEGLTVKDVQDFLAQFPKDYEISWYLIAEDQTPFVGLHPEDPGPDGTTAYPMIVTSFIPYDEVE